MSETHQTLEPVTASERDSPASTPTQVPSQIGNETGLLPPLEPEVALAEAEGTLLLSSTGVLSAEIEDAPDEARIIAKVNRHIMPLFFCLSFFCSLDRANLSFAALQLNEDLNFSPRVYGLGSGIFFIGYACFQIPSTILCARIGAPAFLGISLAAWGCIASSFAGLKGTAQFYVMRFILGLCESGAYPGMYYHMGLFMNDAELGVAYATVSTATAVNGVVGGPIAAAFLKMDGLGGLKGWQWLFLLEGVPTVILAAAIYKFIARGPSSSKFLTADERSWLENRQGRQRQGKGVDAESAEQAQQQEPWWHFARSPHIWYLALIWTLVDTSMDGLVFWAPTIIGSILYGDIDAKGKSKLAEDRKTQTEHAAHAALLAAIPFGIAAISMVVVARHCKKTRERHLHGGIPLGVAAVGMAMLPAFLDKSGWLAFTGLVFTMAGIWSVHGPLFGWPSTFLHGRAAAVGFALMKMTGAMGAFAGPSAIGALTEKYGSYAPALLCLAVLLTLASILFLLFQEPGAPPLGMLSKLGWLPRRFKRSLSDKVERHNGGMNAFLPTPVQFQQAPELAADAHTAQTHGQPSSR